MEEDTLREISEMTEILKKQTDLLEEVLSKLFPAAGK